MEKKDIDALKQHRSNRQIQRNADRKLEELLSNLFNQISHELIPHDQNNQEDIGIDWIYEIEDKKNGNTVFSFNVQNKGTTNKLIPIKKKGHKSYGKIPWQIKKIRHARYYRNELFEPLILTVCDLSSNKIYWHAIQLDDIDSRILEQEKNKKKSIQVYINPENQISKSTLKTLVEEIISSKELQNRKFENQQFPILDIIENSFNYKNENDHILIQLEKTFESFESLIILPPHIYPKLYPFTKNPGSRSYYSIFSLYIDNKKLFDFLSNIKLVQGKLTLKVRDIELEAIEDYQTKLKNVISILQHHLVDHIIDINDRNNRLCLHDLYDYNQECECVKCKFERLDFDGSFNDLSFDIENQNEWDDLKEIYIFYQFGLLKKAYELYNTKSQKYLKNGKYITYFICLYNIKKLRNLFSTNYFENDRDEIIDSIEQLNLDNQIELIKDKLNESQIEVINWLRSDRYIDNAFWNIDKVVEHILNSYEIDQKGGYSHNNKSKELLNILAQISLFIRGNLLIFDNYLEFQRIVMKAMEGFFAIYQVSNPDSSKLTGFHDYIIGLFLFYGDDKKIIQLLQKYDISNIKYTHITHSSFSPIISKALNLIKSESIINELIGAGKEKSNFFFRKKVGQIRKNLFTLLSHLDLSQNDINEFFNATIKIIINSNELYRYEKESIQYFVKKKGRLIDKSSLLKLLNYSLDSEEMDISRLTITLIDEISKYDSEFSLSKITTFSSIFQKWIKQENISIQEIENLLLIKNSLNHFQVDEIKHRIRRMLNHKFDDVLYYIAVLNDLIEYEKYYDIYLRTIPKTSHQVSFRELFSGEKDDKNYKLDRFINLAYYKRINLEDESIQKLGNNVPYYNWLLNIETYDYSKFNPYWILYFPSSIYHQKFKEIKDIKIKIEDYLKENYNKALIKFYFNTWSENSSP